MNVLKTGGMILIETDSEDFLLGYLQSIIDYDDREAFILAIIDARNDVSRQLAEEVVNDLLGPPSIGQIVKGLIR